MKKGKGLMSQITSANHLACNITEQDIKDMFKSIYFDPLIQPRDPVTGRFIKGAKVRKSAYFNKFIVYGGQGFIDSFNKAMENKINKFEWKIMKDDERNKSI